MTSDDASSYDVFVGHPATVEQVQRTIEHILHGHPLAPGLNAGPQADSTTVLGTYAQLRVGVHELPDDLMRDRELPLRLASDFPIRVGIHWVRAAAVEFDIEAAARRVFTVLRAQAWPVALTYRLRTVVCLTR
jgi:hypothetical protein